VSSMMVTYGEKSARDQARSIYLQFLQNYPQTKTRWEKQLGFLANNLAYELPAGRQSVMEAIYTMTKSTADTTQGVVKKFFWLLVKVLDGDKVAACREYAASLIKELLIKADDDTLEDCLRGMRRLLNVDEDLQVNRLAFQLYGLFIEANPERARKDWPFLKSLLHNTFLRWRERLLPSTDWEMAFFALELCVKLLDTYPEEMMANDNAYIWNGIWHSSSFPHAWVKSTAAKLINKYFVLLFEYFPNSSDMSSNELPGPLKFDQKNVSALVIGYLRSAEDSLVPDYLVKQLVQNLEVIERFAGSLPIRSLEVDRTEAFGHDHGDNTDEDWQSKATIRHVIFERLSVILRRYAPATTKIACLRLMRTMCERLPSNTLKPFLQTILRPLHHHTDRTIALEYFTEEAAKIAQKEIIDTSHEIIDLLRKRTESSNFVNAMHAVQQGAKKVRDERRTKRNIERVVEPEKAGREKRKKREQAKTRRKERNAMERGNRRDY